MKRQSIVIDGADVPCGFDVFDGRALGTWWHASDKGARLRTRPLRAIVLHHTGGEGPPDRVYRTLVNRQPSLSIHFVIDQMGQITQMADATRTVTQHASKMNGASIGIEIVSRGHGQPLVGHWRHAYRDTVHGHEMTFLRLYGDQVDAADILTQWLCAYLGIPNRYPVDRHGRALRGFLGDEALEAYDGVMAHYHCSERKVDVDPYTMDQLAARAAFGARRQ